jgi:DNA end-binding protein Ku
MAIKKSAPDAAAVAALSAQLMGQTAAKPKLSTAPTEKKFADRANWTGVLTFGLVTLGIKTFKATDEEKVSFNRVYVTNPEEVTKGAAPKYAQLKQGGMVDAENKAIAADLILSGYKVTEDEFVVISDEEKKSCMVGSDKRMEIVEFVKVSEIDPIYFASAEYVAADKGFDKPFDLLRRGMIARGVVAIAKSNQRGREQTLILRPYGKNGITAHYMYFDNEVRDFDKWATTTLNDKEVEIAGMLIDALTDTFDPTEYSDGYIRTLKGLVNDKIEGKVTALTAPIAAPVADPKTDIMSVLAASLNAPAVTAKKAKKAAKAKAAAA